MTKCLKIMSLNHSLEIKNFEISNLFILYYIINYITTSCDISLTGKFVFRGFHPRSKLRGIQPLKIIFLAKFNPHTNTLVWGYTSYCLLSNLSAALKEKRIEVALME